MAAEHEIPQVIPVFPLTGVVLLPGNWLPLNVFEPRYRAMVEDALAGERHIGMIQPFEPRQDNHVDPDAPPPPDPELYPVGCAGRIERCEPQPDGRYLVLLRGIQRFRVREELPPKRGYRLVAASWEEFAADRVKDEIDAHPVVEAIRDYGRVYNVELELDKLEALSGRALVNGLCAALPFSPAEKQALLEATGARARRDLLLSLLQMSLQGGFDSEIWDPSTAN
jgi:Lon protease-like protein